MNFETLVYKFHLQLCPSVPPIYLADFLKTNLTKFAAEEKKNNGCPLNFYNSYFWPEKNCWTQKVHFGNNVFKNPARTSFKMSSHFEMAQFERLAELFGNIQPFFETLPNEICSHLSEKTSKGRFFKPQKLRNRRNEGKRKEQERGEGKEEKSKKQWLHSQFL